MPYQDLRQFIQHLEGIGQLVRIKKEVDTKLEITEIYNRVIKKEGPALLFENVKGHRMPVLINLYGTIERVALGLNTDEAGLFEVGEFLAFLQHPEPPKGFIDAVKHLPFYARILHLSPKSIRRAPCQEVVLKGDQIDLDQFPILHCWPDDAAPQITWPLVVTRSPSENDTKYNIGIYRMQQIDKKSTIMRWLEHRGGAKHWREWMAQGKSMPVAVALGCDPAMTIGAVTPVPEQIGEYHFAGLLRKKPIDLVRCLTVDLEVPATSEIIIEGEIHPGEMAAEGPHGDHTGFYNAVESFPIFRIKCITHRRDPIYLTTTTGRPPREDAVVGLALNKIFMPLLKQHFPEIGDFHLPMEACSYRIAVISMKKEFPGHAKRIIMGIWGFLKQFLYVKYIIIVDLDINIRKWEDVVWAISTQVDPARDTFIIENTPIDYLDFASPEPGLGSKMGIDATTKIYPETKREWGKLINMDVDVVQKIDQIWDELGIDR
ncbi:MAG: UbiD family decarboxylase [Nitrospira sp.]|nr:UbiD family decarboxylase [Candidatus Manganitrophaceae bacterium]HIL34084.1 UbiD family decarboxylase [Candidatus Manganitrophaceae bacterium]